MLFEDFFDSLVTMINDNWEESVYVVLYIILSFAIIVAAIIIFSESFKLVIASYIVCI